MWLRMSLVGGVLLGSLAGVAVAQESAPSPQDRVEMVKQSLVASKAALKQYEWVETVALSLSGEEKVRQQYRCYYGAEGALQKVPLAADAQEAKKRGVRGKVAESKKAELQASLKAAVDLLHQYSPLDPARIQAAKAAGNVSVSLPGADGRVRITIKNYLKPEDEVGVEADAAKNTLQVVSITSFVEQAKEKSPVSAKVTYAALADGTLYPAKEVLEISVQKLKVDVQNSGYRKQGP
jgi:hypothetical protein